MKHKLFAFLLAVLASTTTAFAWDYEHVQIGDLYYNLDATNNTAAVTYENAYGKNNYLSLTTITIPDSVTYENIEYCVTTIGLDAFRTSYNLSEINLPQTISSINVNPNPFSTNADFIGYAEFTKDCQLTAINIDTANLYFMSRDGVLFNKSGTELLIYPCGRKGTYTIPEGIEHIGKQAFVGAWYLEQITIPEGVTSIGDFSFAYCLRLAKVSLPSSLSTLGQGAFGSCFSLSDISIPSSVSVIPQYTFDACCSLFPLRIPETVVSIGNPAFRMVPFVEYAGSASGAPWGASCVNGVKDGWLVYSDSSKKELLACPWKASGTITIPASVRKIGEYVFTKDSIVSNLLGVEGITDIICLAKEVPDIEEYTFSSGASNEWVIYVPSQCVQAYKQHSIWGKCDIRPIQAKESDVTEVQITPSATTVDIAWPVVTGAASYDLVIKDKDGNVICTLTFNAQGQLTALAFNAPARNNAPQQKQAAGFSFTVTGLEEGTAYDYTIVSKDENGQVLDTQNGSFTTADTPTAIDQIDSSSLQGGDRGRLILRNGQILILRGDKTYTLTGVELK